MQRFDVFDNALLSHGYKDYMRDYDLIIENHMNPEPLGTYSYLFKYGVDAHVWTRLSDEAYRQSLDEALIAYETGKDVPGYVWGEKWSGLYPGWRLKLTSEKAAGWSRRLGIELHEVEIETNAYTMTLIFAELVVQQLAGWISPGIPST